MGFLTTGETLAWDDSTPFREYVREHGILQFLAIYYNTKDRTGDCLQFGDEIEYSVVWLDDENKKASLSLRGPEILKALMKDEEEGKTDLTTLWRPEYAAYMLEGTPGKPFGDCVTEFRRIEQNMKLRRETIRSLLLPQERAVTLTSFPLLGVGHFTHPAHEPRGEIAQSLFTPDELIFPHHRFATLTKNIRTRKGRKVEILVPVYKDENTGPVDNKGYEGAGDDFIYMDSMAFGMGMCCLQCTFQCVDIFEARSLYDQMAVLCPVMLSLTAATPIFRGYLSNIDVRWAVISGSVDDRTQEELGKEPLHNNKYVINKSRYDSIDCFIAADEALKDHYNDIDLVYDKEICKQLEEAGIDNKLARHIAHLFIRDPLVIYKDKIEIDDSTRSDHFENIQSTNWQTVRFKPPPPGSSIGWRTEFRPMEIQFTDFENAAFVVFMVLLTRTIRSFRLNMYIPITKVDENLARAATPNSAVNQKFYFRKDLSRASSVEKESSLPDGLRSVPDETGEGKEQEGHNYYREMAANEIINGSSSFVGLIPLVRAYLSSINVDVETSLAIDRYLALISKRASGELITPATWIRNFVTSHPAYKKDSVITEEINYDLIKATHAISEGRSFPPELLGDLVPAEDQISITKEDGRI